MERARRNGKRPMSPTAAESVLGIQSVQHALDILECLVERRQLGVNEMSAVLGIHKATVSRHLANLESRGYVARDPETGKFSPGLKLIQLASRVDTQQGIRRIALPLMQRLRDETGETIGLYLRTGDHKICIAAVESWQAVRRTVDVGAVKTLYPGAVGKILLAYMDSQEAKRILGSLDQPPIPDSGQYRTIRDELAAVRAAGYYVSRAEVLAGAITIAVPIFGSHGTVEAVVNLSGPIHRMTGDHERRCLELLQKLGHELSRSLGYSPVS